MNEESRMDAATERRRKIIRIVCIVLCAIWGVIILCNVISVISNLIHPDMPPGLLGLTPMVINTTSMEGTEQGCIREGSLVVAHRKKMEKYREGDVVAFCEDRQIMVGRITVIKTDEAGNRYFHVKADGLEAIYRDYATEENMVGKIWLRMRWVGDLANFMDTWAGIILFEGLPWLACLGIVGYEVWKFAEERKKTRAEETSDKTEQK